MCTTNWVVLLIVISHLLKTVTGPEKGHGVASTLAGRAGRVDLDDVGSCRIGVVQVVPIDTVANWSSLLESPYDIVVILPMVIFGRWPLCQIPCGFTEKVTEVWLVGFFLSCLSVGSNEDILCFVRQLFSNHYIEVILFAKWGLSSLSCNQLLPAWVLKW